MVMVRGRAASAQRTAVMSSKSNLRAAATRHRCRIRHQSATRLFSVDAGSLGGLVCSIALAVISASLIAVHTRVADADVTLNSSTTSDVVIVNPVSGSSIDKAGGDAEPFTVLPPTRNARPSSTVAATLSPPPSTQATTADVRSSTPEPRQILMTARGVLKLSGLKSRRTEVYAAETRVKKPYSQGYFGVLTSQTNRMKLPAGRYVLKYVSDIADSPGIEQVVDIKLGELTSIALGEITISNLVRRHVMAFEATAAPLSTAERGYAGSFGEGRRSLQVPAGQYRLKFYSEYAQTPGVTLDDVMVHAGQTTELLLGRIQMDEVGGQRYMVVRHGTKIDSRAPHTSRGFAGWLAEDQSQLELPPGRYELRLAYGRSLLDNIEVLPNHHVTIQ